MKKIIEFFKNTTVRVVSVLLLILFILSIFIFFDAYVRQFHKAQSFYHVYRGDKFYKKNKPQEAIESYQKALKLYPGHWKARFNLANIYVAYEDFYSALDSYSETLKIKPDFMIARIDYGIVLSEATFNYDRAIQEYEKAIKLIPKWVYIPFIINNKHTYKYNKGIAYYNLGLAWRGKSLLTGEDNFDSRRFLKNAVEAYENALKTVESYEIYYNLGLANHLLKNINAAGRNYCKAISLEPLNYEAHYNLAILLKNMRHYSESADEFKKAGLILDVKGDINKTRYIYDVLNEVSQAMTIKQDYSSMAQHLEEEHNNQPDEYEGLTYLGGKVVITDELDRAIVKNFKTCAGEKLFEGEDY